MPGTFVYHKGAEQTPSISQPQRTKDGRFCRPGWVHPLHRHLVYRQLLSRAGLIRIMGKADIRLFAAYVEYCCVKVKRASL